MDIDFNAVFLADLDWSLGLQIVLRTLIMFSVILVFLRLSGKKGVSQLSIFEVAIIIGLGSAAGDPMFNPDNAIVPALIVFATIMVFYRLVTWGASRSERFESLVEGDPVYVIEEGMFVLDAGEHTFAKDEFFAEMRQQNIEHLGQVQTAILETNGNLSFFYYADEEVKPGLPVLPKLYHKKSGAVSQAGQYACTRCGQIEQIGGSHHTCPRCQQTEWVEAVKTQRRT
ncbi:YetF domain-containing protein [Spirosoma utsteinense]|uniref:Membrane protein YcaP (DUF421 family) n=1 Tax=Spirosoma utsteinense TaxID=2585773 RepID=A0ABR6W8G0_9BACT|nr:YetF domain-containing protein [Spirosoma utsteinense]MBC3787180.1 putative membrane protein YcaP (DUF421 family) [Spirosoma utsteinense]MBC3792864.1 putative membrane protein YcaP (DUF421 family) [Spirosoma utsteinense]